jgi:hypothetical protein
MTPAIVNPKFVHLQFSTGHKKHQLALMRFLEELILKNWYQIEPELGLARCISRTLEQL